MAALQRLQIKITKRVITQDGASYLNYQTDYITKPNDTTCV